MSAAETSAYLLMAGGLIWVLVGIALWRRGLRTGRDRVRPDREQATAEQDAKSFAREEQDKLDSQ
jgi:hypothetical protein